MHVRAAELGGLRRSTYDQSMSEPSPSGRWAVVFSLLALAISVYSALQSRRAADANERLAAIAQEQIRPRLVFLNPCATLSDKGLTISVSVKNIGNAPAAVRSARVKVSDNENLEWEFGSLINQILYPNDVELTKIVRPRIQVVGGHERDNSKTAPGQFTFDTKYELLGHSDMQFHDSVQFHPLQWTIVNAIPPGREF
jgi:hypothetical protein